jgi:imidazolonepropionase-like amidohydrolase
VLGSGSNRSIQLGLKVSSDLHCIEHGTYLSDKTVQLMKEKGTYLDPTLSATLDLSDPEGEYDNPILQMPRAGHAARSAGNDGESCENGHQNCRRFGYNLF